MEISTEGYLLSQREKRMRAGKELNRKKKDFPEEVIPVPSLKK